jgi:hypothetical protein
MKHRLRELLRASDTPQSELVVSACPDGIWILVYAGEPFQVRREQQYSEDWKYLAMSWSQRGSAERQARYLNDLFQTDQFEIAQIQGKTAD